ncbi:glyoxalase [Arsenicitalea aurantiaca]|uniref:Glyoxalase n=1 Tax=Arsenicitalea aurantiaca TaxID=1783274 RepID=A0A433XFY8_9HYPH|nr:VOC family protein [Arsenicitalea aurantiaca]RUT33019.1 glyoxalase [Arsenicitalea aurantiaca]
MRMIFVNLPVKSVAASRAFFGALGFSFNETYCSEDTLCVVIEENIFAMLITHDRFLTFSNQPISDATQQTEVLTCLSCASRDEVDALLAKALANGGRAWKPTFEMGPMYGASFQDPDGHVWELMAMDGAPA